MEIEAFFSFYISMKLYFINNNYVISGDVVASR